MAITDIGKTLSTQSPAEIATGPYQVPTSGPVKSSAIPVDALHTPPVTPPVVPPPPVDTTNHAATIAGAVPPETTTPKVETPATDASSTLLTKIKDLMGMDTGQAADKQAELDKAGATALEARKNSLTAKLTALNDKAQAIPLKAQNDAIGVRGTQGAQDQSTRELRDNAIQALSYKAEYDLISGDLENAKANAQLAVDKKYKDIETEIDHNTKLLQLYTPFMNEEQKAKADAVTKANDEKKTELATKKQQQADVINAAQTNGDSTSASLALKLDPNSKTFTDDLAKIQASVTAKIVTPKIIGSASSGYYQVDPTTGAVTPIIQGDGNSTPKGTTISGNLKYTPDMATEDEQALQASRGEDGHVDPSIYLKLHSAWIANGGLEKDFLLKFPPKNYVNPDNTWLPPNLIPPKKAGDTQWQTDLINALK